MKAFSFSLGRKNLFKLVQLPMNSILHFKYNFFSTTNNEGLSKEEHWNKIYSAKLKNQIDLLNKELSEYEKKEVEVLIDRITELSKDEIFFYTLLTQRRTNLITEGTKPTFSSLLSMENTWPPGKENWLRTQNSISTFASFSGVSARN